MLQHDLARGDAGTTGAAFPGVLHHDAQDSSVLALAYTGPKERVNARNLLPDGLHRKALERTNAHGRSMGLTTLGPKVGHVSLRLPCVSGDLMLVHRRPMLPAKPSEDSLRNQGTRVLRDANFANGTAPKRNTLGNWQQDRAMKLSGKVLAVMVNTVVVVTKASKIGSIRSLLPKRAEVTCKHKITRHRQRRPIWALSNNSSRALQLVQIVRDTTRSSRNGSSRVRSILGPRDGSAHSTRLNARQGSPTTDTLAACSRALGSELAHRHGRFPGTRLGKDCARAHRGGCSSRSRFSPRTQTLDRSVSNLPKLLGIVLVSGRSSFRSKKFQVPVLVPQHNKSLDVRGVECHWPERFVRWQNKDTGVIDASKGTQFKLRRISSCCRGCCKIIFQNSCFWCHQA